MSVSYTHLDVYKRQVISQSLKAALALRYGIESTVICPLETEPEYTEKDVLLLSSEEDIKEAIMDADTVIADPIYKTICSEKMCIRDRIWSNYRI